MPTMSKIPISASSAGRGGLRHAVVVRRGDEVRADQPVGRPAADPEGQEQRPEHPAPAGHPQRAQREPRRPGTVAVDGRLDVRRRGAVRAPPPRRRAGPAARGAPAARAAGRRPATRPAAQRQPGPCASCAIAGRKISWPVELAAENRPVTRPRWRTNQRLATMAPKTSAMAPVPTPTGTPHRNHSCHDDVITRVSPEPAETRASAPIATTRRIAEALHQRGGERCRQAVDDQVEADRARGGGPAPAELLLQGLEQGAGRGPEAGGRDQGRHRRRSDPPGADLVRVPGSTAPLTASV